MILRWNKIGSALALHKFIRLRQRYILTKNNKLRLRYTCAYSVFITAAAGLAVQHSGVMPDASFNIQLAQGEEGAASSSSVQSSAPVVVAAADKKTPSLQEQVSSGIRKASALIEKAASPAPAVSAQNAASAMASATVNRTQNVQLARGETIAGVLEEAGVSEDDAYQAVKALSQHVDPRAIRAGQTINIQFTPGRDDPQFSRMTMNVDSQKSVTVRKEHDQFLTDLKQKQVKNHVFAGYAQIENSLYGSAERAGIPPQALAELIKLYSRNVDFQRDIHKGDKISVLYEGLQNEDGKYVKYGTLIYANLTIDGKNVPLYRFQTQDGHADFYDAQGRTTRKTLLKTPVDGARITSGFGMRFHPILGYTRMHKGIDFGAPTGTPIYAAGDGVIDFEGRKNGYGNYIRIRHNSQMETAYAHMSRFGAGTHAGARVRQGDLIGYVGASGEATGPHLHYEVLVNNNQVNPRSIDLPTGENLSGKELARFRKTVSGLTQQFAAMTTATSVAQASVNAGHSASRVN